VSVCAYVCMDDPICMYIHVCERKRERESARAGGVERGNERERERKKERERERRCVYTHTNVHKPFLICRIHVLSR